MSSDLLKATTHKLHALEIKQTARLLLVSISGQTLQVLENERLVRAFSISTSKNPPSCLENSFGTPTGLHRIAQKLCGDAPLGAVLKGRIDTGKRYWELPEEAQTPNLVTTRILWLDGLEPGHNQGGDHDSHTRYIYIHGTNHEDRIGTPSSGGCIQLRNKDVIELFNIVSEGDQVYIG